MPGGFSGAREHKPLVLPSGTSFYPLICYEAIFPAEITESAGSTNALLNVTNDAWFGNSPGPYQHFHQARIRAVETGLPLIRGANSGISAIVDAKGRILLGLSYNADSVIDATLPGKYVSNQDSRLWNLRFPVLIVIVFLVAAISRFGFINQEN